MPNQCQEQKPNYNPNSDRYSIYSIIFHALEYATASKNRVDNHTQPYIHSTMQLESILDTIQQQDFIFIYNFMCHVWKWAMDIAHSSQSDLQKTYDEKLYVSSILMCVMFWQRRIII